jgi:hypothetical protein
LFTVKLLNPPSRTLNAPDSSFNDLVEDLALVTAIIETLPESMSTVEATVTKEALKPLKPIMGDAIALSKDSWSAWTGGKPKADWTGLEIQPPPENRLL